jgi:2-polyprenyl-6-methoxyphenol hydroxylase-like FAD-dependent oxidoreductase
MIDALGTRSPLSAGPGKDLRYGALWTDVALPPAGFDRHMLSQRYRRSSVMAGVLPVGTSDRGEPRAAFFWSLRAEDHEAWLAAGLDRWKGEVQALWPATLPILEQIRSLEQLTFARYAHKTLRRPVGERLIHIGDSWHSASPQLGQGANMALLDAYAVATALRHGCDLSDSLTRAFRTRRNHVRLYQLLTALLTPVYQSDSRIIPVVRDWVMGPLSRIWPMTSFQAALVSGLVGSPLRKLGIDFAPPQVGS